MRILRAAVQQAALRTGEIQLLLRAGDGNVAQAAFLLHVFVLLHCTEAGEQPILHAREEYDREFQTLGGMHGHHDNRVIVLAGLVGIRVQRHVLEKIAERRRFGLVLVIDNVGF